MRAIIAAIALVFVIGVVMPTDVDARAPTKVEKWGCTFRAVKFFSGGDPSTDMPWGSGGVVRDCDPPQKGTGTLSLFQDVPGGPDRLLKQETFRWAVGPGKTDGLPFLGGFCKPDAPAPTDPFYVRVKFQRKGQPGSVSVATPDVANPCPEGTFPLVV